MRGTRDLFSPRCLSGDAAHQKQKALIEGIHRAVIQTQSSQSPETIRGTVKTKKKNKNNVKKNDITWKIQSLAINLSHTFQVQLIYQFLCVTSRPDRTDCLLFPVPKKQNTTSDLPHILIFSTK